MNVQVPQLKLFRTGPPSIASFSSFLPFLDAKALIELLKNFGKKEIQS